MVARQDKEPNVPDLKVLATKCKEIVEAMLALGLFNRIACVADPITLDVECASEMEAQLIEAVMSGSFAEFVQKDEESRGMSLCVVRSGHRLHFVLDNEGLKQARKKA